MANIPTPTVKAVHNNKQVEATQNGTFAVNNDDTAFYRGLGDQGLTFAQVTQHFLGHLAKRDATLQTFAGESAAGIFGAAHYLEKDKQFAGKRATDQVPAGQDFNLDGNLKALLAPFVGRLDVLREKVTAMAYDPSGSPANAKITGKVASRGLGLPLDI